MSDLAVLFAGGGTGGHGYPAIAIAEALETSGDDVATRFCCSRRPLDAEILAAEDRAAIVLPAAPPGLAPARLARFAAGWGASVRLARQAIRDLGADVVVATGGFVCPPVARAARVERVPLVAVTLDAVAGRASRVIARAASAQLFAAPAGAPPPGWTAIPPIVRAAVVDPREPAACRVDLGLDPDAPTLLVTGGSQGARSINRLLVHLVETAAERFAGWQVLHQTGRDADVAIETAYDAAGVPARVTPYLVDMAPAWRAATLALGRAGAGTVGELWATATPAVLLPYPHHADDHQLANAARLVDAGAAIVATDHVEPAATAAALGDTLFDLLADPNRIAAMRMAFSALGAADGAARAAAIVRQIA